MKHCSNRLIFSVRLSLIWKQPQPRRRQRGMKVS